MERCRECGATGRLNADGVCEWRGGCEHRQFQAQAGDAEARWWFEPLPCGHTRAEHVEQINQAHAAIVAERGSVIAQSYAEVTVEDGVVDGSYLCSCGQQVSFTIPQGQPWPSCPRCGTAPT